MSNCTYIFIEYVLSYFYKCICTHRMHMHSITCGIYANVCAHACEITQIYTL